MTAQPDLPWWVAVVGDEVAGFVYAAYSPMAEGLAPDSTNRRQQACGQSNYRLPIGAPAFVCCNDSIDPNGGLGLVTKG